MPKPVDYESAINRCLDEFNANADGVAVRLIAVNNSDFDVEIISQDLDAVVFSSADDLAARFRKIGLRGDMSWFTKTDLDKMLLRFRL
ncbi:MAG: hypothetical protein N3G76_01075 [Candidatus Micrarchaeota archaeon]|nr:hypothetical protein [Candidatus Micrarchaeota archaeon]